jgi:hypothetical protein
MPNRSDEGNNQQAGAHEHEAGCSYREEPGGHEILVAHGPGGIRKRPWFNRRPARARGRLVRVPGLVPCRLGPEASSRLEILFSWFRAEPFRWPCVAHARNEVTPRELP